MVSTAKIALITGGNRGSARATALALAAAGTDDVGLIADDHASPTTMRRTI